MVVSKIDVARRWLAIAAVLSLAWPTLSGCRHSSEPLTTLGDTTSHAIQWRTDTIGFSGSVVRGIDVLDDNSIWAVGEFYLPDSTGNADPMLYNVLRWDGVRWNPLRLTYSYGGTQFLVRAFAVISFSANDVWISNPGPLHWDGQTLSLVEYASVKYGSVEAFWGTASSNLFMMGVPGTITYYNGISSSSIPTGVQSRFSDIYGTAGKVFVSSYSYDNQVLPSGIFVYDNNGFRFLFPSNSDSSSYHRLQNTFGVWVSPTGNLWAVAEGSVFRPFLNTSPEYENPAWLLCIRGTSDADVWAGGVGGSVLHFNGATWMRYQELSSGSTDTEYHHVAVKGNTIAFGGVTYNPDHVILTIGSRVK
jgi:hypothetical protein